ncbi:MAG TPA: hypothetical protein VKH34_12480 [Vicinamibacterales bacterium]|nr:hypothetical protein [Vicinamibacterales bacterium]
MKRKLAMTAVLAVALAVVGYAQKPDFSGTWTPEAPAAAPAGGGGGGGGRGMAAGPMTVTQKGDSLVIERTMGENKVSSTYKLDGTESVNKMAGRGGGPEIETKSTAKWDGSKLTIVTKQAAQDGTVRESSQSWWLEGGNLVVESTRTGRDGAPATTKAVYKKTT